MKPLVEYIYDEVIKANQELVWMSDLEILHEAYDNYIKERKPKRYAKRPKDIINYCMNALRRESNIMWPKPMFTFHGYIKSIGFSNKEYDHPAYKINRRYNNENTNDTKFYK